MEYDSRVHVRSVAAAKRHDIERLCTTHTECVKQPPKHSTSLRS